MSWHKQTVIDKEVVVNIPVRVWFEKYGTLEYWQKLEKLLQSEVDEMEEFLRDHRSRDHYDMYVRDVESLICRHCGYDYGQISDPENITPNCCDAAMDEAGVE